MRASSRLDLIDTRHGTDSHFQFSTGNTLPLVTLPHGMTAWTPQTSDGRFIYDRRCPKIQGFRATHQPSPWIADYGHFLILVASGDQPPVTTQIAESFHSGRETVARPDYYRTFLARHGITAELTPTERGCALRFTFTHGSGTWIAFQPARGSVLRVDHAQGLVQGISTAHQGGVPGNFGCHFAAHIDARILETGGFENEAMAPGVPGKASGRWLRLERPAGGVVTVKVATSFVDDDQALANFERELQDHCFDAIRETAIRVWEQRLGCIDIATTDRSRLETFYRCLFRCFVFPRKWHEVTRDNRVVHYSPFNGRIQDGPFYTDCGLWDVHRTLLPLITLLDPDLMGEIIQGWLNAYQEGGWLPNWISPGYRDCMVTSHCALAIADAWVKGVRGFDPVTAWAAMQRDILKEPRSPSCGRPGLSLYKRLGHVPADHCNHSVARTADYAYSDFAVAAFARAMGKDEEAAALSARALNYRNLFDPDSRFLRAKLASGAWVEPFDPYDWSIHYIEGGPWQHSWAAPHDARGLIRLHGGDTAFVERLDRMLDQPARYNTSDYAFEIHEMTEMAAADFGQYAHSNQPVHHVLYLYTCAGRPDRTQHWVRRILTELYSPEKYPGDEDNGEMSAWYVLSSLGFYPLCLAHPAYVMGAPLHSESRIRFGNGRELLVEARGLAPRKPYVARVLHNGRPVDALEISHGALAGGGSLVFEMTGSARAAARRGALRRPFSLSGLQD